MNNSTTHTKDRTIKRTLSLLLAGLMMFGLFGMLPLYGCSGGDATPVATPGKDALQNATPGSDDAGQPTAEITAEPTPISETPTPETPIPETPTPECTDEPSPTPWNPEPTPTPKPAYSYYELYYDILRDRLHRRSSGLRSFHDMESDPEMRVKYENGELWTYDFYTGEKLRQYPEELYQYAYDRLECDDENRIISYCYGRENWVAFVSSERFSFESARICIMVTVDDWETWHEIRFKPDHDLDYYADEYFGEDISESFPDMWAYSEFRGVGVASPDVCVVTMVIYMFQCRPLGGDLTFVTLLTTDGGEHWRCIDDEITLWASYYADGLFIDINMHSPYFEGEEGIAPPYYATNDGGRTWAFDEELWSYYQQLWKRATLMRAVRFIDRFTRTDGMRENAIKQ